MSLASWGWEVFESDETLTGSGRILIGKSRKGGENRDITLTVNDRKLYQLEKLFDELLGEAGEPKAKRAIALLGEDFRKAIARARREHYREDTLRRHNFKPQASAHVEPNVPKN